MSDWVELKILGEDDKPARLLIQAYDVVSLTEDYIAAVGESTSVQVSTPSDNITYWVAEPYDEVKRKIFEAMEPKYQVQITNPNEEEK